MIVVINFICIAPYVQEVQPSALQQGNDMHQVLNMKRHKMNTKTVLRKKTMIKNKDRNKLRQSIRQS